MNSVKIQELLSLGEGQRVEFKSSPKNVDALGRVICGFLNTAGGFLVCGISDQGDVLGMADSDAEVSNLEKRIHDGLSPKAMVSFHVQTLEALRVLVIEVPVGADVPYAFRDVIYIRDGDATQKADAGTIRDIVMRRQIEPERWERRFSFADTENDVDVEEVRSAVADALKVRRAFFRDSTNARMVLEDLSVSKYGRLTNGGDVLFTMNPAGRLPQVRVRALRYNTDKAGDTYRDMKSFEGPLHAVFEDAYSFIVRNTPSTARFRKGKAQREDFPVYPEEAVREALINALAHRDYSAASGGVSIHVYPRRLEIWNSGGLPGGVTVDNLIKGHISVLRNPDIAHGLYIRGLMEKVGRGSVLMIDQCRERGLPAPIWTSDEKLGVTVTFRTPEVTPEVTQPDAPPVTPPVAPPVTPPVQVLVSLLSQVGALGNAEIRTRLGLKDRTHLREHYLNSALAEGLIEQTLPDKPNSRFQKYRLTAAGVALKKRMNQRGQA
jgi:ATP-dependent DNA helicase RecG